MEMTAASPEPFVIAIDGPSGSGKSTVGKEVARRLGLRYVDTGAMYRAVALAALRRGMSPTDEAGLAELAQTVELRIETDPEAFTVYLNGEDVSREIRGGEVEALAPHVAQWERVRDRMVRLQREAAGGSGVVMEGRDIGTVVFPGAAVKIFLEASPQERSRRRSAERGTEPPGRVVASMQRRDEADRSRPRSPLQSAPDAVRIDSTSLSIEEVVARVVAEAERAGWRRE